jgi:hypothetical protein
MVDVDYQEVIEAMVITGLRDADELASHLSDGAEEVTEADVERALELEARYGTGMVRREVGGWALTQERCQCGLEAGSDEASMMLQVGVGDEHWTCEQCHWEGMKQMLRERGHGEVADRLDDVLGL